MDDDDDDGLIWIDDHDDDRDDCVLWWKSLIYGFVPLSFFFLFLFFLSFRFFDAALHPPKGNLGK